MLCSHWPAQDGWTQQQIRALSSCCPRRRASWQLPRHITAGVILRRHRALHQQWREVLRWGWGIFHHGWAQVELGNVAVERAVNMTAVHFVIVGNLHRFRRADVKLGKEKKRTRKKSSCVLCSGVCWGSGPACFCASRIRIHQAEVRIRILPFSEIMLAKQDFNTKFWQKIKFLRLKIMCLWLS